MKNHLLEFLRDAAAALKGSACDAATLDALEGTQEAVRAMFARYEAPAPAGAEAVRESMREALHLFFQAIELLLTAHETGRLELLPSALAKAEEGSDLLEQVEYLIAST